MKWDKYPASVLPMWVADMDFAVAPAIASALHARADHGVFGYTLPTDEVIEVCCAYFARRWDWQVEPEWLVFAPGLGVVIHTVTRYLGNLELGVLTPSPIYHIFRKAPPRASRPRIDVPFVRSGTGWEIDANALVAAASAVGGAGVVMLCNPHNPNGKVYTRSELELLGQLACEHDWVIYADEVHADLILDADKTHIPIASLSPEIAARCITSHSPSKAFNVAGLNFAVNVIADPVLRKQYVYGASGQVVSQLNPFGYAAAVAAWNGSSDAWLADCVTQLRINRDLLFDAVSALPGISTLPLPATYLAWLDVSELGLADAHAHFVSHGLGLSPGKDFGDANYLRLNFGCDQATLELGIKRLRAGVAAAVS